LYLRIAVSIPMVVAFVSYCWATRQLGVVALIFVLQAFIYSELVHVALVDAREAQTPGFFALYYYWFGVAAFFMYARVLKPYVNGESGDEAPQSLVLRGLRWLVLKHVPVSFALYCVGIVLFVISLRLRRNFRYQFAQLAYCHMALLAVVGQSTLLAANAFAGLIWVLLPTGLIIVNDSFAYLAGAWGVCVIAFPCPRPPLPFCLLYTRPRPFPP
jgi:phosphatidate cytidylyltransferase